MQDTSSILQYDRLIQEPHILDVAVRVGPTLYEGDMIESVETECQLFGDEIPAVGNACSRTLTLRMLTPPEDIALGAMVQLFVRLRTETEYSGWMRKGYFMIDSRRRERTGSGNDTVTEIVAYDSLAKADAAFPAGVTWPMTDADAFRICIQALGLQSAWAPDKGYTIAKLDDQSYRSMLGYIAAAYGGNFTLSDIGQLDFVPLRKSGAGTPIIPSSLYNGIALPGITQVTVYDTLGKSYTSGSPGRLLEVDCPFASQTMADNLLAAVRGYSYQPFSAEDAIVTNPALELGDLVTVGGLTERICKISAKYGAKVIGALEAPEIAESAHTFHVPNKNGGGGASRAGKAASIALMKANWNNRAVSQVAEVKTDKDGNEEKTADGNTAYTLKTPKVVEAVTDRNTFGFVDEFKNINVGSFSGTTINFGQLLDNLVIDGGLSVLGNLQVYDGTGISTTGAISADGLLAVGGNATVTGSVLGGGFESTSRQGLKMPANGYINIGGRLFGASYITVLTGEPDNPVKTPIWALLGASG